MPVVDASPGGGHHLHMDNMAVTVSTRIYIRSAIPSYRTSITHMTIICNMLLPQ